MDYIAIQCMPESIDTFDHAISAYEGWAEARVTIHDLDHSLSAWLSPRRMQHFHPLCQAIKQGPYRQRCLELELANLQRALLHQTQGRLHRCHAGFIEAVVPVFEQRQLKWVFFAGPWLSKAGFEHEQDASAAQKLPGHDELLSFNRDQLEVRLEGLHQLASRIYLWQQQQQDLDTSDDKLSRRQQILHFMKARFHQPLQIKDLARLLHISETRAAHVCREECGETFLNLLQQIRLHHACTLLQHTRCSVQEAAQKSGFNDSSYFHRVFRKWIGMTPAQFRQSSS